MNSIPQNVSKSATSSDLATRPIDKILAALNYQGPRDGRNHKCTCPAHDDRKESLSVTEGDDGKVLVKCFAGCDTKKVLAAVGLKMTDLFPPKARSTKAKTKETLGRIVATYDYTDANGKLLYQVTRHNPKDFRQRQPDGNGGWLWSITNPQVRLVLYCLPELLAAPITDWVFVVEGEKDVDNLRERGLVATCNVQGAGKWKPEYNDWLRDRHVCILPDNKPSPNHCWV
jgi:putative DNA primase/helicase